MKEAGGIIAGIGGVFLLIALWLPLLQPGFLYVAFALGSIGGIFWIIDVTNEEAEKLAIMRRHEEAQQRDRQNILDYENGIREMTRDLHARATSRTYLPSYDFVNAVRLGLEIEISNRALPYPDPKLWEHILRATKYIYEKDVPLPLDEPYSPQEPFDYQLEITLQERYRAAADFNAAYSDATFANAFIKMFSAYLNAFPKPSPKAQFHLPITDLINTGQLISDMTYPFTGVGFSNSISQKLSSGIAAASDKKNKIFPNTFEGDVVGVFLHPMLQPLFWLNILWGISDATRTLHHRVLGGTGTGKSTYLSHYILHDLPDVAEGNASLVVIDSQRLARQISRLKIFAKGEPLHNNIIIADADPNYPLALNPFHTPYAEDFLGYILGQLSTESSDQIEGAIAWMTRAITLLPKPTLRSFRPFFEQKGKDFRFPYPDLKLDEDTRYYFKTVFPDVPSTTRSAIGRRLMNMTRAGVVDRTFGASAFKLDLYEELKEGGKVILVDTNEHVLSGFEREIYGRLFIAMIDKVVTRRGSELDETKLKYVYFLLDEAQDYVAYDPRFANILEKARSKRVCVTIAHHHEEQIKNLTTKTFLDKSIGIQSFTSASERDGKLLPNPVSIKIGQHARSVYFPPFSWTNDMPTMSNTEYHELREHIFSRYGATIDTPVDDDPMEEATTEF